MHIYFNSIGGTGIGPLAVIAKEAGFDVSGSDMQRSQYTDYLKLQGMRLHIGQSKEQIAEEHAKNPIDWIVFSSAALIHDPNHPELMFAKENGIKFSKRDECLNMILRQKDLKLLAVAGTHGKTTTTALIVWLFKQLAMPVSYSVGAKLSFGPMGHYDKSSEYFVYECDEFDRNFLSFRPNTSVITVVDWDHHDIYPTRQDYKQAFKDFIAQSDQTYIYDRDCNYLGVDKNQGVNVLNISDLPVNSLKIAGLHNRQNSWVAINAVASILGKSISELISIANEFPGTSRRFELLTNNIYSDYAHTPEEISATLQMARELSDNVVVVYEPLTDRRQHYMKEQYKDTFNGVKKVYWLHSYLAREDPNLPILTPNELVKYVDNSVDIVIAKKDENLKNTILNHVHNGELVICIAGGGGGSLDEWIRKVVA